MASRLLEDYASVDTVGTDWFHALTIQDTGGTRATIDVIKTHVALLHGA